MERSSYLSWVGDGTLCLQVVPALVSAVMRMSDVALERHCSSNDNRVVGAIVRSLSNTMWNASLPLRTVRIATEFLWFSTGQGPGARRVQRKQ